MIEQAFSSPTCFGAATVIGFDKIIFVLLSLTIAFGLLAALKKATTTKSKIFLAYTHLAFLFFPLFLLTTNTACGVMCMSCHNSLPALFAVAVPASALAAVVTGFIFLPSYFIYSRKTRALKDKELQQLVKGHSRRLGIKPPRLYAIDSSKPAAFSFRSFRSAIFMSIGLKELLTGKEKEAVLLHELAHIKERSSAMKLSKTILNIFSPLSLAVNFYDDSAEEKVADSFAVSVQATARHINSAKRKMKAFHSN